jgi:hypothetical protein
MRFKMKIVKAKDVIKKPVVVVKEEPSDYTEVEQEFILAQRLWNKGYRQ